MLQPTDEITVRLAAAEWNQVMAVLGEGPFRVVAPLIQKIQQQAMAQDPLGAPAVGPNGQETALVSN